MSKKPLAILGALLVVGVAAFLYFNSSSSNEDKKPPVIDPAFSEYVAAFTSGVISKESTIKVRLSEEIGGEINYDTPIDQELFEFDPAIEGDAYWKDRQTIEFIPAEPLPSGIIFDAEFALDELVTVPDDLETFIFQFQTIKQAFVVNMSGMRPYNNNVLEWQQVSGSLNTADVADPHEVEQLIAVTQKGKVLRVSWTHSDDRKVHQFVIDSVARTDNAEEVLIQWSGQDIGVDEGGEERFEVPALGDFKLMSSKVVQQPEQYILLQFSDPLDANQNLRGLITVGELSRLRYVIEANEIRVYPSDRQTGEQKLTLDGAISNVLGYKMGDPQTMQITFEDIKPAVRLVGSGNILPSSDGLVFPFEAVNLKAVDVRIIKVYEDNVMQFLQVNQLDGNREMKRVGRLMKKETVRLNEQSSTPTDLGSWNRFYLDLAEMIKTEPGAIYRVELGFKKKYATYPCESDDEEESDLEDVEDNWDEAEDNEQSNWDYVEDYYGDYYYDDYYYYDYDYSERDNPCSNSYYGRRRNVAQNVLASDLGIIAKGGNDRSMHFAVTDLKTTAPLSGVVLEVYDYQQQLMGTTTTDAEGIARIESTKNKPFILVAKQGDQRGYMRLDDGSSLALSRFDVGGTEVLKGLKGYLYGERGVWRPGDSLYLSFILEDKNQVLPAKHPVTFELLDPQGQVTRKLVRTSSMNGFYNFNTTTDVDAPTGNWRARVKVGGTTFTERIKVEAIKPNRLKILLDFGTEMLSANKSEVNGELKSTWLHGAIARNLKADVMVSLKSVPTKFKKFNDYVFDDPTRRFDSEEQTMFEGRLNDQGVANVAAKIYANDAAPGMLKATFKTRVFEEGGDFSIDQFSSLYSPYESYVGIKLPKGDKARGMLLTDTDHEIKIVTLDEDGKPVARDRVDVRVYKVDWRWWWDTNNDDGLTNYNSRRNNNEIAGGTTSTGYDGTGTFSFQVKYPDWGRYLVRVTDPESGHATGQTVYIDWPGWAGRPQSENPGGASMLLFSTNKDSYTVGETANLTFPSSGQGRALVSIENGTKVLQTYWVDAQEKETHFSFEVTPEMAPNVYLNVTLVQPHNQTANDLPIRLYGVLPITVENPETHIDPIINMPDELAPEKPVTIKVKEQNGKKMTYTVAVVDEGLLDLTRFETPDAWEAFYAREALGVKTWDVYDQVMGAFGGELERLLALGGDEEGNLSGKNRANRFKPMVKFLGPFELDAGESAQHTFTMPKYIGSVRTMVVAGQDGAYGSAEKTTPVKTPLMVLATLPRVVGPGEQVKLPVTVFAMEDNINNVSIEVKANGMFKMPNGKTKSTTFSDIGDKVVSFDLQVAEALGVGKVTVVATSGKHKASYDIELDVRHPNPQVTDFVDGVAQRGSAWTGSFTPIGIKGTNKVTLEVSAIPPVDFGRRLQYLTRYPHGCVEQTTSGAFPQLFLSDVMEVNNETKSRISENVKGAIKRLRGFQGADGGLSYWPGNGNANEWGTTYAGHFMLEAEKKGYALPAGFKKRWRKFQRKAARNWKRKHRNNPAYQTDDVNQAYRLYTLALDNSPELGAMNRLKEMTGLSVAAKWRLAAAYQMAGQPEVAKQIVNGIGTDVPEYKELSYSYGSRERDVAMIVETLTLMGDVSTAAPLVKQLSNRLSSRYWLSTQTTAYSLIAISKFAGKSGAGKGLNFTYTVDGGQARAKVSTRSICAIELDIDDQSSHPIEVKNNGAGILYVRVIMEGTPMVGEETEAASNLRMNIIYKDMQGNVIDPTQIEQGTDFMAEVSVSNPGTMGNYQELALTQIFPSGWEIRNMRLDGVETIWAKDLPTYMDIRDDRVLQYFDLRRGSRKTFRVLLNASYQGRFYLPPVYCEAMYDNTINARMQGQWVQVVPAGGYVSENQE